MALTNANASDAVFMRSLTDCMYFVTSHCKRNDQCYFRHCREAAEQSKTCFDWPKKCRDVSCPYRHPAILSKAKPPIPEPVSYTTFPVQSRPQQGLVSFFWDIENVPIPKGQKPFDIVQRIRQKLVTEAGLREYTFSCYCKSTTISDQNQISLHHGNVSIVHVPDRKPGAVDRQILLELDRFERAHRPPATVVLISGDIDFVGKLSDLRFQAGFHVIVIHNKPIKEELKSTVNAHFPWEIFIQPEQEQTNQPSVLPALMNQPIPFILIPKSTLRRYNGAHGVNHSQPLMPTSEMLIPVPPVVNESRVNSDDPTTSTVPVVRSRRPSGNATLRRRDLSLGRPSSSCQQNPASTNPNGKKQQKRTPHSCPQCTNQFDSVQALRQHQEAKNHMCNCPVCNEGFFTREAQAQHQKEKNHHGQEFTCARCNRDFTSDRALNQHKQAMNHADTLFPPLLQRASSELHIPTSSLPPPFKK